MTPVRYHSESGLIKGARYVASPNSDNRPEGVEVEALVIHAISLPPGEFGNANIEQFFCNMLDSAEHPYYREIAGLKVSAHFLICRDGELVQFVPCHQRAWHAGESFYRGRAQVNDFSIGIELEGCDDLPFEDVQYRRLAELVCLLNRQFPHLSLDRVIGHVDIAPGRKNDPGPNFDWTYFRSLCK